MKFISVRRRQFAEYRRPPRPAVDRDSAEAKDPEFRRSYYAFTALGHNGAGGQLMCGMTHFAGDLLYSYDPATAAFRSAGYAAIYEPHEVKIHRGLCIGGDGCVYGATSTLSPIDQLAGAPGAKVFRYDPATGKYDVLGQPCPGLYIQTISLDWQRRMIYGMAYPDFEFFAFSIAQRRTVYRQYMGSISHIGAVDDGGGYWGTWLNDRHDHCLFRYDGDTNKVKFFPHGFPTPCRHLMYYLAGPIDAMLNGGDGFMYIGHESGELYRLDWRTGELTYLCKPMSGARLPALSAAPDGLLLGVGGSDWATMGFAYDRASGKSWLLGAIKDSADGSVCFRTHDCCLIGDTLYVGETDNPERSCYLWECRLGP